MNFELIATAKAEMKNRKRKSAVLSLTAVAASLAIDLYLTLHLGKSPQFFAKSGSLLVILAIYFSFMGWYGKFHARLGLELVNTHLIKNELVTSETYRVEIANLMAKLMRVTEKLTNNTFENERERNHLIGEYSDLLERQASLRSKQLSLTEESKKQAWITEQIEKDAYELQIADAKRSLLKQEATIAVFGALLGGYGDLIFEIMIK